MSNHQHRVVIVGGGFAGLNTAQGLARAGCHVTLIDKRNHHLFQPLLYQVATGGLSPANIATPLRKVLKRQRNTEVVLAHVEGFDAERRVVRLRDGEVPYDTLVVAAGMTNFYFGKQGWEQRAPGLKSIEDAVTIRRRVLLAFEAAERETDPERIEALLTFVVVGGGPTGVELAGALAEIAHDTLRGNFRNIDPEQARVVLLEGGERLLATFPEDLSAKALPTLARRGVQVRTGTLVTDIRHDGVTLRCGEDSEELPTHTVLWAAGVRPSPLATALAKSHGAKQDRMGRVIVEPDCTIPDHPEVFVAGDMAHYAHQTDEPLPGIAPVANHQGKYVARVIRERLKGGSGSVAPFRHLDLGSMAVIGRTAAVVNLRFLRFGGMLAWLIWLFIHLMYIVEFGNRALIFMQWAWNYVTYNRSARLITGPIPSQLVGTQEQQPEKPRLVGNGY